MKCNRLIIQFNGSQVSNEIKQDHKESFFCKSIERAIEICKAYNKAIFKRAMFRDKEGCYHKLTQQGKLWSKQYLIELPKKEFSLID